MAVCFRSADFLSGGDWPQWWGQTRIRIQDSGQAAPYQLGGIVAHTARTGPVHVSVWSGWLWHAASSSCKVARKLDWREKRRDSWDAKRQCNGPHATDTPVSSIGYQLKMMRDFGVHGEATGVKLGLA